jgi:outer membrane protein insertion porin family
MLLILGLFFIIAAPKIDSVEITGNRVISKGDLLRAMGITPGQAASDGEIESVISKALEEYARRGRPFATINYSLQPKGENSTKLILIVNEGREIKLGDVRIVGNSILNESEIRRTLGLQRRGEFDHERFRKGVHKVLRIYAERGHPLARIRTTNFHLSEDRTRLSFDVMIEEGPPVRISDVKVSGLKKTKPDVILRQLPIKPGMSYRQSLVDETVRLLRNMPYIYDVDPAVIERGERDEEVVFNASVTEARTGRIEGLLGYAPPEIPGGEASLTGTILIHEMNILGTGRSLYFEWRSTESRQVELRYLEPWLLNRPLDLSLRYLRRREGIKSYGLSLIGRLGVRYFVEGGLSYERAELERESRRAIKFDGNLRRDSRDYILNPRAGNVEEIGFGVTTGDYSLKRITAGAQLYLPTWGNHVLAIGAHLGKLFGGDIPSHELFSLGGANTLRGYTEGWFQGRSMAYVNLEYRFLTGLSSHLFGFVDLGTADPPQVEISYGLGGRLESRSGRLNVYYGLARGDSILGGKIHVSLGTAF